MANSVLLRILGDGTDAKAAVREVLADVKDFGRQEATADIRVDASQAKREIAEVAAEFKALPREKTIAIRVAGEQAYIEKQTESLKRLTAAYQEADAAGQDTDAISMRMRTVAGNIDRATGRVDALRTEFANLGRDGDNALKRLDHDVKDLYGHIPLVGGALGGVMSTVAGGAARLLSMLPGVSSGFASAVAAGLSMAAIVPIVLAIGAGLAAIIVSLAQALIGLAALGIALLAALGPVGIILFALVEKFKAAYTAQQKLTQATQTQKSAVMSLHAAQQAESQQRLAALRAEKQAYFDLIDAGNQLADAKLNVKQTALDIQTAKQALSQYAQSAGLDASALVSRATNVAVSGNFGQLQTAGGSNSKTQLEQLELNLAQAIQSHKEALDGVAPAQQNYNDKLNTNNGFVKNGIKAYGPYATAVKQTAKAALSLHDANKKVATDARAMAGTDGVLGIFDRLKHTLGVLFGPAIDAAFKGLGKALGILATGLKPLAGPMEKVGKAVGNMFVSLAKAATSKAGIAALKSIIEGSAKLLPQLVRWAIGFGHLLLDVANSAMPALIAKVKKWAGELLGVSHHQGTIKKFIDKCITSAEKWWGKIKDVLGVVIKLAGWFKTMQPILGAIAGIISTITHFLGAKGTVVALMALLALKGGGGGGLIGGALGTLLKGGVGGVRGLGGLLAEGGGLGVGASVLAAAGGGVAIGTGIDKLLGLPSFFGGGEPSNEWNVKTNAAALRGIISEIEKSLATGIEQFGPHMGRHLTLAMESSLIAALHGQGVNYTGPVAKVGGSSTVSQTNQYGHRRGPQDAHHEAVSERRIKRLGKGGLK